jgi:hypothetical protein
MQTPEHPDDAGQQVVREVDVERPRDADDRQLEDHQHEAARDERACERAGVAKTAAVQKRARAGEKRERRRAEMRDPPREEDAGGWSAGRLTRVHAHVIDRHQDHDEAPHHIDRSDASGRRHSKVLASGSSLRVSRWDAIRAFPFSRQTTRSCTS